VAERQHTGRFSADDTVRRWVVRIAVAWLIICLAALALLAFGVWKVAT
jgi:hypothetical protein